MLIFRRKPFAFIAVGRTARHGIKFDRLNLSLNFT